MSKATIGLDEIQSLSLERGEDGKWRFQIAWGAGTLEASAAEAGYPANVKGVLDRHQAYDSASRTHDIATEFSKRGWVPSTPGDGSSGPSYVLWQRHGEAGSAAIYQNSEALAARSDAMRTVLASFPSDNVEVRTSDVIVKYRNHYAAAVAAIEWLTAWTDGGEPAPQTVNEG